MSDTPDPSEMRDFEERLAAAKRAQAPDESKRHVHHDAGAAWRMVIELVTGIVVGFGIGYGLDTVFGTLPIFLVLFTLLGFGAGVRVMMQTAQEAQRDVARAQR
jgi:ATP synthase protein I